MDVIPQSSESLSDAACDDRRPLEPFDQIVQPPTVPDHGRNAEMIRGVHVDLQHALEQFPSETTAETQIRVTRSLDERSARRSIASNSQPDEFLPEERLLIVVPAGPPVKPSRDIADERRRSAAAVGRVRMAFGRFHSRNNRRGGFRSIGASIRQQAERIVDAGLERLRSARASALVLTTSAARSIRVRLRQLRALIGIRLPTLAADASRRAALLVAYIHPVCALLAPYRAGASTPIVDNLIPTRALTVRTTGILTSTRRRWRSRGIGLPTVSTRSFLTPALIVVSAIIIVVITRWNTTEAVQPRPPDLASEPPKIDIAKVVQRDDPVRAVSPAVAPAPTPPPRPVDVAVIQRVLNRYRDAYSILSVSAVRAVWPSVDALALRRTFSGLAEQNLEYNSCRIAADAAGAVAVCRGEAQFTRVGARTTTTERREWRFTLRRSDKGWLIATVSTR